jgi:hypothetical protein
MKEKIIEILEDNKEWGSSIEYTADQLLILFGVIGSFSELDMQNAYNGGVSDGESGKFNFDIENYL